MLNSYTGIFTTRDELLARRVLSQSRHEGKPPVFLFKDGFYEIVFPGILPDDQAQNLAAMAHTFACVDLKAQPLSSFKQEEI